MSAGDAPLPAAPRSVADAHGEPRFGTYTGELPEIDLHRLRGRWDVPPALRLFKRKRWLYALVSTHEVLALFAVVDLGYTASAFIAALDLQSQRPLCDLSFLGVPGPLAAVGDRPGPGLEAVFHTLGGHFAARRGLEEERYQLEVEIGRLRTADFLPLQWRGTLLAAGGGPPVTVISPVGADGLVNVTQKWSGMFALGSLTAGGRTLELDGGVGGIDYTQGYLARETAWRWAFAAGRVADGAPVGLNLVEGFNDASPVANENAFWLGDRVFPLARARFEYDPSELLDPWRITTVDGAVDLRFRPAYVHRQDRDYHLVASRFAQPLGVFEGTVRIDGQRVRLSGVPGVTEQQETRW